MTIIDAVMDFERAWNSTDDGERRRLLARCCTPDAEFSNPYGDWGGVEGLARAITEFRSAFPQAVCRFGDADEHHGWFRLMWATQFNDGRPDLAGEDFGELAADGRIRRMVSFSGPVPEL
jgi:hypothetical protein